ncbi:BarA sensory histidine kinase (= VarS = GacS) [hydrothermal vent metagenome]|uniref:BarA sensory histidine kinase (= VarS = GacS) n=1 Tax=hydrothermal vent metagenome TaxID=652676 RepID=A0A1W1CKM5_9ZZZZ
MGGQLDLHSEPGEGTTFFFTLDFEEIAALSESAKGAFSSINALVLESSHKTKRQDTYLREYLDFYGVSYTTFKDENELAILQKQVSYDLLFTDYEYATEDELQAYSKMPEELILLTKSYFMRKIDSMALDIFKTIYEPLNSTKLKSVLDSYNNENFKAEKAKKANRKKYNAESSKFDANVLVAEDNIINQKLIKRTLEDLGLHVDIASNGLEAFQKRKDGNYDLIFMDIQMPFLDGTEATKEILEYEADYNQPHVPIIALTANALKGDRERFLRAGLDEYTTKPLVRAEIVTLLNHFLLDHIVDAEETVPANVDAIKEKVQEPVAESQKEVVEEKVVKEQETQEESTKEVTIEEPLKKVEYKADILLAKRTPFETKLFAKILDTLGHSYEIVSTADELKEKLAHNAYKAILFDKDLEKLDLATFTSFVQEQNEQKGIKSALILITNESIPEDTTALSSIDEVVKSVVNRDSLENVIKKFI